MGYSSSQARTHQGEGHVQFKHQDSEAQRWEAGQVRVHYLPCSAGAWDELRPQGQATGVEYCSGQADWSWWKLKLTLINSRLSNIKNTDHIKSW